jgi:hypothetical protein
MEIGDFFREESPPGAPSDTEQELLRHFQRLDPSARDEVLDFVRYKSARRVETWRS